jgi:N-acetylmuramoyl-L-alanine amidase
VLAQAPPVSPGQADSLSMAKDWAGTVNFNMRKPNFVIIHHTAQSDVGQTLKTFTISSSQVSAHYVIADDGVIHHMLNDYLRAYHAGVSKWGNITDLNSVSIGIELDNNGSEPFSEAQISSLLKLLGNLKKRYSIPTANFIAHADVAPKRKPDPHEGFPWKRLADNGFGLWYDENPAPAPPGFDPVVALRVIGYDTSDLNAAIVAFKRHFIQSAITPVLTQQDLNALNNLYRKYL